MLFPLNRHEQKKRHYCLPAGTKVALNQLIYLQEEI